MPVTYGEGDGRCGPLIVSEVPRSPDAERMRSGSPSTGRESMRRWIAPILVTAAAFAAMPAAHAAHSTDRFVLIAEEENFGTAANGDHVEVTVDEGSWFQAAPKSLSVNGEFTHVDSDGNVEGAGTWTATSLLSYSFYGCRFIPALDVDTGNDDFCGGAVKMAVTLDTPLGQFPGILTVFCIVGPQAPSSHNGSMGGEGVTLNVPGIINFNHTGGGDNIYIRI
jgi:hypothetical protein